MTYVVVEYPKKEHYAIAQAIPIYSPRVNQLRRMPKSRVHAMRLEPMFYDGDKIISFLHLDRVHMLAPFPKAKIWCSDSRYSLVPDKQIDAVREREAQSMKEPERLRVFKVGDIVQSQDWHWQGQTFKVVKSNAKTTDLITESGVPIKGHLTQNLIGVV